MTRVVFLSCVCVCMEAVGGLGLGLIIETPGSIDGINANGWLSQLR